MKKRIVNFEREHVSKGAVIFGKIWAIFALYSVKKTEWVKRITNIVHAGNNINFMSKKLLVTNFEYKHNENFETVLTCEKNLQEKSFGRCQKSKAHLNKTGEKVLC